MKIKGREVIGSCGHELLIADSSAKVDVVTVTLAQTSEVLELERGCVLTASDTDGKCKLLSGATGETAAYILAENATTSATGDVVAEAYQTGKFIRNALIVAEGYSLSIGDEKALRNAGIYLESAMV